MEFKFRAGDARPPSFPSSSNNIYFPGQPPTAPGPLRPPGIYANLPVAGLVAESQLQQNPNALLAGLLQQVQNERIREDLIVQAIARKRMLETLLTRELVLELERTIQRAAGAQEVLSQELLAVLSGLGLQQTNLGLQQTNLGSQQTNLFGENSGRLGYNGNHVSGQQQTVVHEIEHLRGAEGKSIVQAIQNPVPEANRKTEKAPAVGECEVLPFGLKKRPKDEFSCALCQYTAADEKTFSQHLLGKKHRRKETLLKVNKENAAPQSAGKTSTRMETVGPRYRCNLCNVEVCTEWSKETHEKGVKHLKRAIEELGVPPETALTDAFAETAQVQGLGCQQMNGSGSRGTWYWCNFCKIQLSGEAARYSHEKGKKHLVKALKELRKRAKIAEDVIPTESTSSATAEDAEPPAKRIKCHQLRPGED